jgi:hypothetical protein
MCYSELAVYCALKGWWGWVMRKPQTSLTYRGDKLRERYQMLKKIFWGKKMPVRLLYERVWGTTISPLDEVCYIVICLCETLNILKSHYKKKIFQDKKWTIS